MQRNNLIWLGVAALLLVGVTVITLGGYRSGTELQIERTALEPNWAKKLARAARIKLDSPAGELNLVLDGEQWRVVERHDYPADNARVWQLLQQVGELELLEAKTSNPELHERLNLRDRSAAGAQSMQLLVSDGKAQPLINLLLGKDRHAGGQGERQYYLRRVGDNQTWVASGDFNPARLPTAWLNRDLIDIAQTRIREVTVQHPGQPLVRVSRPDAGDAFQLQDIPAGRAPKVTEVTAIAYGLQKLPLQDVNRVEEADLEWDQAIVVKFITFDGLTVTVKIQRKDLGIVGRFSVAGVGEAAAEADALNARLSPWVYVIPNHTVSTFTRTLDALLEPLAAVEAEAE